MKKITFVILGLVALVLAGFLFLKNADQVPTGGVEPNNLLTLKIGETGTKNGYTITPRELAEDSRCPLGTQCIWAGTVKVRADIQTPVAHGSPTFELGKALNPPGFGVVLISVQPEPKTGESLTDSDYIFVFEVSKTAQ